VLAAPGNAGGLFFFYAAAASGPLSIVTSIGSVGVAVPVLIGVTTGDTLGVAGAVGIVLAIGGVALAARRRSADATEAADLRRTVALASLGAVGFGIFLTALKPASSEGVFWGVLVSRASLLVLLVGGALVARSAVRVGARDLPKVALPGLLLFAGTMLYASATRHGLLSVVSVIGSLNPVVTVTLALVFLHERLSRPQWAGVGAALTGVVLLSV
jgi:drug/metabolite transporter (DMT)-like permease